jgi:hypothetical protein
VLEHAYAPRDGSLKLSPQKALGRYLERPYLHYTIGTRVRPSMLKDLDEFGVGEVEVHDEPPPFEPEMVRATGALQHDPDWQTRMYSSYLKTGLLKAVHRGGTSNRQGSSSFVPSLAEGVHFKAPGT